jgi:hypothetical protein
MFKKIISLKFDFKEDYKYPFFLISLVLFLFVPSLVGRSYTEIIGNILYIVLIISSLALVSADSKVTRAFVYFVGISSIILEIVNKFIFTLGFTIQVIFMLMLFTYFIALLTELLSQIFKSKTITLNVVMGAFTGYIMIGIIGHFIFRLIFFLDPSSFAISSDSSQELIYYTFITLTTIGYGDISPLSDAARNFAMLLGLVGQFYNAVIIAIIIGKFLQR